MENNLFPKNGLENVQKSRVNGKHHLRSHKYGFLWWIIDENDHSYVALGDGGNVIYVNPNINLTISIGSYFKPRVTDRIKLIKDNIEPLFQ